MDTYSMSLRPVVLDFESYFDNDYTFQKLTTEEYVRHPKFEVHGAAIKFGPNLPAKWWSRDELPELFAQINWDEVLLISHHAQWDHFALNYHYNVRPKMSACTMSMARLLLGSHIGVSLDSVRAQFNMKAKTTPYNLFRGKHWHELPPVIQQQVADGAIDEVESIWNLFCILGKDMPAEEFEVIHTTITMFSQPALQGDVNLLAQIWERESIGKATRAAALNVSPADLQSADRFAQLLRDEGIEPEMKPGKNKPIYAFAKNDEFMRGLQDVENERIKALVEARLGEKSTGMQTRAETLGWMASRGPMPVYIRYCGAGTLRFAGGDDSNFTNLKRGSDIRQSLKAPPGYFLAPIDSSQIECRVLHYLAGGADEPVIQQFRAHQDPYVDIASQFYGETIYKPKTDDPRKFEMESKRGMGKQGRLMCGYGASGKQFKMTAKAGLYGPPVEISIEDSNRFVALYRDTNPSICAPRTGYWAQAGRTLARLAGGDPLDWGPLHVRDHRIYLPNGCPVIYDTLEFYKPRPDEEVKEYERNGYWRVQTRRGWKTMWGSKLVQNICEAVSRVIVTQAMVRIVRMGYRVLNIPHDELLVLIPKDGQEQQHLERCMTEMKMTPTWLPGLPLDAEGGLSERYSK